MLPRKNRLTSKRDVLYVIKNGRRIHSPFFTVIHLKNKFPHSRIAFVVSKKISPSAVARHLYQRQLRHIARDILPKIPGHLDLVVITKPNIKKIKNTQEIKRALAAQCIKVR